MKKIISLILIAATLLLLCVTLASCASLESYKDTLKEEGYKVKIYDDEDDIEDWADAYDVDADDYDVKQILDATHKKKGYWLVIVECGSSSKAEDLLDDLDDVIEYGEESFELMGWDFVAETNGNFVFFGEERAVEAALGK